MFCMVLTVGVLIVIQECKMWLCQLVNTGGRLNIAIAIAMNWKECRKKWPWSYLRH